MQLHICKGCIQPLEGWGLGLHSSFPVTETAASVMCIRLTFSYEDAFQLGVAFDYLKCIPDNFFFLSEAAFSCLYSGTMLSHLRKLYFGHKNRCMNNL